MFSNPIKGFFNDNPYDIIESYATNNPEEFKKDIKEVDENGNSILINFLKRRYKKEFYPKIIELLYQYGYDLKDDYTKSSNLKYSVNKNDPEYIPEFINSIFVCWDDEVLLTLAKKLDKEYILNLEKEGWAILEYLYQNENIETIKYVSDFGLDYDNLQSGGNLLRIAEKNQRMVDLYWEIKNKRNNSTTNKLSDEQYKHFISNLEKKLEQISSSKDNYTSSLLDDIKSKIDLLNVEQKKEVLSKTVIAKDLSILKYVAKQLDIKSTDPLVQRYTLLNCEKIQNKDLLVPIINNPQILREKFEITAVGLNGLEKQTKYGVDLFNRALRKLEIYPYRQWGNGSRQNSSNASFREKLAKISKEEIISNKNNEGKTLFDIVTETVSKTEGYRRNEIFSLLNASYSKMRDNSLTFKTINATDMEHIRNGLSNGLNVEQKNEINEFLNQTWRKNGGIEKNINSRVMHSLVEEEFFIINSIVLQEDIYSKNEKVFLFSEIINYLGCSGFNKRLFTEPESYRVTENSTRYSQVENSLKALFNDLVINNSPEIINININEKAYNEIKDTPFMQEIQAVIMKENLTKELKSNLSTSPKKMKI